MKVLELFAGSQTFTKVFRESGHDCISLDFDPKLKPDIVADILKFEPGKDLPKDWKPDIIWASPPCQAFSVASLFNNWRNGKPISNKAYQGIAMLERTIEIIKILKPKYFFIENPRGMMRTLEIMKQFKRNSITYCRYGLAYQKPTDIWTNCSQWIPRKKCKAGDLCHQSSPRGSKTGGIQSLSGAYERGKLPIELCKEILKAVSDEQREVQTTLNTKN